MPPTVEGLSTGMRLGYLAATLGLVALLVTGGFVAHNTAVELRTPAGPVGPPAERPSAAQLIVGNPIALPAALFEANQRGASSLVTPAQATDVATAMWHVWEKAQVERNTRALSQLITAGSLLQSTILNCAAPSGQCVPETSPRTFNTLVPIVPVQTAYPLYFMAEFETTELVTEENSIAQWEPWVEVQILTKASPTEPWMLSFDSGYNDINPQVAPPLLPFDEGTPASSDSPVPADTYNPRPTNTAAVDTSQFLPSLAAYYQSFKDSGGPPSPSPFVSVGYANQIGQGLATNPQGAVYAGSRQHFTFTTDPTAGQWEFAVQGGYPMICGSVDDTSTNTAVSGLLYQNPDENNFGPPLAPGTYRVITTKTDHETCVYTVTGGLDTVGNAIDTFSVTGQQ